MSIFSCFRKKENLESWLNKNFKGQYEILDSRYRFMEKFQFSKKATSVVGSIKDPEVQFVVTWYRGVEGLRMTTQEVEDAFAKSTKEVALARELYSDLTKKDSFNVSVSVLEDAAYFLVYAEPSIENRQKYLYQIMTILDDRTDHGQINIFVEFMEDSVYHKEFKNIVPAGYWNRIDKYHQQHNTVSLDYVWTEGLKPDIMMKKWTVNTYSDRSSLYREDAYLYALKWAEKNIHAPYYIEPVQLVGYDLDEKDLMAIHFHFPYFPAKPAEDNEDPEANRIGYISGVYQIDKKTFSSIEKGTEF